METDSTKYEKIIIDILHKLPSDDVSKIVNFAKFLSKANNEIKTTEEEWEELHDRHDLAISLIESGKLEKATIELKKIIKLEPLFIDAYNHLGIIEFDKKNYRKALDFYEKAFITDNLYEIITNASRNDSTLDLISWLNIDSRPFFRAMHGIGLCNMKMGNIEKAIEFFELILKYDPNDHQFVSFLLGDLHFKVGHYKKAKKYYTNFLEYIPYKYSLALLNFQEKKVVDALTLLRKGFITNINIAKSLLDINPISSKEEYNHIHVKNKNIEEANEYKEHNFEMWKSIDGAIPFLRSVYNNSIVKSDTQTILKKQAELFSSVPCSLEREYFIKQEEQMENGIDDSSSKKILKTMETPFHQFYS